MGHREDSRNPLTVNFKNVTRVHAHVLNLSPTSKGDKIKDTGVLSNFFEKEIQAMRAQGRTFPCLAR